MGVEAGVLEANPSRGNWSPRRNSVTHCPGHLNEEWVLIQMGECACSMEGAVNANSLGRKKTTLRGFDRDFSEAG